MKKRWIVWILVVIAVLLAGGLLGWWLVGPSMPADSRKSPAVRQPVTSGPVLTVYYPSRKYIESGNESIPMILPKKVRVNAQTVTAAISLLQQLPNDPDMAPAIRKDLKILDIHVDKKIAYVNFSADNLFGGSLEEMLLVQSVVKTLNGIQGVQKIQFLVDGEIRETLMGHIETSDPIGVNDL